MKCWQPDLNRLLKSESISWPKNSSMILAKKLSLTFMGKTRVSKNLARSWILTTCRVSMVSLQTFLSIHRNKLTIKNPAYFLKDSLLSWASLLETKLILRLVSMNSAKHSKVAKLHLIGNTSTVSLHLTVNSCLSFLCSKLQSSTISTAK